MIRFAIILLLCAAWVQPAASTDEWTAWLVYRDAVLVDSHGKELQRITLPVPEGQRLWYWPGISHNGKLFAYISVADPWDEAKVAQLRVYDTASQQVRLVYDFPFTEENSNIFFSGSSNFSPDDTQFAIGYDTGKRPGWRIVVFDLASGAVVRALTRASTPPSVSKIWGNVPIIVHFTHDDLTFSITPPVHVLKTREILTHRSIDWHLSSNVFSENCQNTYPWYTSMFDPTGEVIETGTHPTSDNVPHSSVEKDTIFTLEYYNPTSHQWQVFYESRFSLYGATFVQNGERIVIVIDATTASSKKRATRLVIIERDGSVVDQLDVEGSVDIEGTNDGFVYTLDEDRVGWVTKLTYVNTRSAAPFAHQSVIFESKPDELLRVWWAKSNTEAPLPQYMPWGNRMSWKPDCPTNQG